MGSRVRHYDVVIVGAGPAGMSASMWCNELRLNSVLIERSREPGGQLHFIYNSVNNYIGLNAGNGRELLDQFLRSDPRPLECALLETDVTEVNSLDALVTLSDGRKFSADAVILATGVRRRRLGVAGERRLVGSGILRSGVGDSEMTRGRVVAIVGGGDAAVENAIVLSHLASKVYLIHRGTKLSARPEFISRAKAEGRIEFLYGTKVTSISGRGILESIEVIEITTGKSKRLNIDNLLIRIGVEPNSELVLGQVELDDKGYVLVDRSGRSSNSKIYAIGDVASPLSPTIATACGMGATAVKTIASLLDSRGLEE